MKQDRLNKEVRFERIISELRARPTVRISQLAADFGVSTETVRRDIDELSRRGLVDRTYGGAAAHPLTQEPAVNERFGLHVAERVRIAECAATLVTAGDVLMIDAGSTTTHFAQRLAATTHQLTVLTNGLGVALALGQAPSIRVLFCPGDFDAREGGTFGSATTAFLGRYNATKCFVGASGLTSEGPGEANSAAAWVKRGMIERSDRRLLLIDQSKFDGRSLELVCPLDSLDDLVTDSEPPAALTDSLAAADVMLHLPTAFTPAA